jgi:hypothetical protein
LSTVVLRYVSSKEKYILNRYLYQKKKKKCLATPALYTIYILHTHIMMGIGYGTQFGHREYNIKTHPVYSRTYYIT